MAGHYFVRHNPILFCIFDPDITFPLKYDCLTDGVSLFNVKATYMGLKEKQGKREVSNKSNDKKKKEEAWSTDKFVAKILSVFWYYSGISLNGQSE